MERVQVRTTFEPPRVLGCEDGWRLTRAGADADVCTAVLAYSGE